MSPSPISVPSVRRPDPDPERLDEVDASLVGPRQDHDLALIANGDISRDLTGTTFTDCLLENLSAHGTVLTGGRLVDTVLSAVNAPSLRASRLSIQDVLIADSRLGAVEMTDASVRGLVVEHCKLDFLNLRGSDVVDVVFRDCHIGDLDMGEARMDRIVFEDCQVDVLEMAGSRNRNVDLRGLQIGGVRAIEGLRGTTVTPMQLVMLSEAVASHLGIRLEE